MINTQWVCLGILVSMLAGCQLPVREMQPDILSRESLPRAVTAGYLQQFAAARELEQSGKWEEATAAYERLAELAPDRSEPSHRLAVIADQRREFERARKHYEQAIRMSPDDLSLRNDFGYSLLLAGDFPLAIEHLQMAVEQEHPPARAQNNLAMALVQLGEDDRGLAWFLAASADADAHYNMAFALEQRGGAGDAGAALQHLQMALQADPQHQQAAAALASYRGAPASSSRRLVAYREDVAERPATLPNARSGASRRVLHRQAQAAAREGVSTPLANQPAQSH